MLQTDLMASSHGPSDLHTPESHKTEIQEEDDVVDYKIVRHRPIDQMNATKELRQNNKALDIRSLLQK
jgi:hypothetical protein